MTDTPVLPPRPGLVDLSGIYCSGEDSLRITSFGSTSCVLSVEGRFMRSSDGCVVPFNERHIPNTDRTSATSVYPLAEGWLSNVQVRASTGTVRRGQVFAIVELVRGNGSGALPLGTLVEGYVSSGARRSYPGSPIEQPTDGRGIIRSVAGSNVAANTELTETVPVGARWRLIAVAVTLVCDATVANRIPSLIVDDGATQLFSSAIGVAIVASATTRISWSAFGVVGAGTSNANNGAIPPDLILLAGFRVRTVTSNIQAGDDYAAPQLLVEEWIEP